MELKTCSCCGISKPFDSFPKGKTRKDGSYALRSTCKECTVQLNLDVYHNKGGKEKQKQRSFKNNLKKYGITPEDYKTLLEQQQGRCKICSSSEVSRSRSSYNLFVDHDHKTGKVRGLLCHHCNMGLGHFKDDTKSLKKAIEYLNESSS